MQVTTPRYRLVLLLVGVLLFGGAAWLNGGPIGNAGAWLMVVLAIGWPSAGTRAFLNADAVGSPATYLVPGYSYGTKESAGPPGNPLALGDYLHTIE